MVDQILSKRWCPHSMEMSQVVNHFCHLLTIYHSDYLPTDLMSTIPLKSTKHVVSTRVTISQPAKLLCDTSKKFVADINQGIEKSLIIRTKTLLQPLQFQSDFSTLLPSQAFAFSDALSINRMKCPDFHRVFA